VHYLVGISRDIHDQKTSRQQLAEANQALEQSREQLLRALADLSKSHEDLKAAQLQLIQAEKMESVGRLAAGIAHEVKNPLATIRMGIEYLRHVVPEGSGVPDTLLEMDHAVSRADRVMRELLDFSSAGDLKRVPLSINQVIKKALQLTRAQLERAGIKVSLNLGEDLPQVRLDRIKIEQVIVNLVMNACHAMPGGGDLVIRTSVADAEAAQTRNAGDRSGAATRAGDREVLVEVEDCGTGIPEDKLSVVFDPFFTTKPTGIGTGLGLTVVQKIMELHGGAISLKNKTTGGTGVVARLRFPF
jgi:signal transduction histidine kinase